MAITLSHNLLHYRLLLTCLKTITRGLLVLTWLSPAVGINSKAVHNPGKEGGYGFSSSAREGHQSPCPGRTLGQVQAALCLAGCEGRVHRGTANTLRQLQLGRASRWPDLSAAVPPGPGRCARAASPGTAWHSTESRRDRERASQHRDLQPSGVSEHCHGLASLPSLGVVNSLQPEVQTVLQPCISSAVRDDLLPLKLGVIHRHHSAAGEGTKPGVVVPHIPWKACSRQYL